MILVCYGTRPEALKLAPVVAAARRLNLPVHVHCTMQSPDLLDREILPWQTLDSDVEYLMPDVELVVVQGDTRTAFEWALQGYERGIPIFHIEAGLRTHDTSSPWPEEGYRQMISRIARYHACTSTLGLMHLIEEKVGTSRNLPHATIRVTGSPVVESVRERAEALHTAPLVDSKQILLTLHRRENRRHFGDILRGVSSMASALGYTVVWPTHPNGWAQEAYNELSPEAQAPLRLFDPMSATAFTQAMLESAFVVTDSGGVQEECNVLGVPCVVARRVTDRPESVGAGGAILPKTMDGNEIFGACVQALDVDRRAIVRSCFGDGTASRAIAGWWQEILR